MSELKPCPFCGDDGSLQFANGHPYTDSDGKARDPFYYTVKCKDEFCGCRIGVYEDPEMAIEAWNRRVHD